LWRVSFKDRDGAGRVVRGILGLLIKNEPFPKDVTGRTDGVGWEIDM
jgi:hypothetical protein